MILPSVAIVGGGPGGLTLARLLECKGIDYVVYERDESERSNRTGGSLDINLDAGQLALRGCGLLEAFRRHARYDDTVLAIADKHGKKLLKVSQGKDNPEIDRVALRQILLEAIPKDKIKWGHALKETVAGEDGEIGLTFTNGSEASGFKLVVGADGAWSKVRRRVWGHHPHSTTAIRCSLTVPAR